ncbi:hypothetical protein [Chitinophaga sp. Cy-1792]|uniref:hypothetical protein n=1 Tax=Chitinophaga sp. Cy-1792 TaxID=2608339 RepID=UPI0014230D07|nr:hypothetical protein [Chitinophaga sp. Cy-1792]NIG54753.1 hypothetical protein [Chitinophaga sp. Cy-1792]
MSFGLIKNERLDPDFLNAKVERDLDTTVGQKTIKIREAKGIDADGNFIYLPETNGIPVPADGNWYWIKLRYLPVHEEQGEVSLAINGDLVGVGTSFTTTLRGLPNFPSRIAFPGSKYNKQEYDVLEVIDDQHARVAHPATTTSGIAEFVVEEHQKYRVVGTFTPGAAIPNVNKYPFEYDGATYSLTKELDNNKIPGLYNQGREFYIARVKAESGNVIIQDKRLEYWMTQADFNAAVIDANENPLIGVESVKWQHPSTPANKNQIQVAWGMRSQNWSVDSSFNILTLLGGALGGIYKSTEDFTNGDFDGWRLYFPNGNYRRVISSVKQGLAINLQLDVLDINDVSSDGGETFFTGEYMLVVPDCDHVLIKCAPDAADNIGNVEVEYSFPVNALFGICEVDAYKDPVSNYQISYRYQTGKGFTPYAMLPSDMNHGFLTEDSFSNGGLLKPTDSRVFQTYTSSETKGFIPVRAAAYSYSHFVGKMDKGDINGVNVISAFTNTQMFKLQVGKEKIYQYVTGNITMNDDLYISLSEDGAVEGNRFTIHFDCTALGLSGKNIYIVSNYGDGNPDMLKKLTTADVWHMLNHDGGIIFNCVYNGSKWVISANYELQHPYLIATTDGVITDLFDTNGWGKVKGYFGYHLCDGREGTPDLRDRFIVGAGKNYQLGKTGGAATVTLSIAQMPKHKHGLNASGAGNVSGVGSMAQNSRAVTPPADGDEKGGVSTAMAYMGNSEPHENMPPYYALYYFKKMF